MQPFWPTTPAPSPGTVSRQHILPAAHSPRQEQGKRCQLTYYWATWQCPTCGIPSFTFSFFKFTLIDDSSLSNVDLDLNASGVTSPVGLPSACSSPNEETADVLTKRASSPPTNLGVLVINCRSIDKKKVEFWNILHTAKPGRPIIVILSETWLNPNISNHEIFPTELDYKVFRRDRPDGYGGVIIGIGPSLDGKLLFSAVDCEAIFVKIDLKYNNKARPDEPLIIGACYRPTNRDVKYMDRLCSPICDVAKKNKKSNPLDRLWFQSTRHWLEDSFNCQLPVPTCHQQQYVHYNGTDRSRPACHLSYKTIDNTLDLFFTNRPSCINKCQPIPGISDHEIVHVDTDIKPKR